MRASYLDVSDELQSWCFYWGLAVYDSLYSSCPPHGFIQHLSIKTVGMLPPVHDNVPVACKKKGAVKSNKIISTNIMIKFYKSCAINPFNLIQ